MRKLTDTQINALRFARDNGGIVGVSNGFSAATIQSLIYRGLLRNVGFVLSSGRYRIGKVSREGRAALEAVEPRPLTREALSTDAPCVAGSTGDLQGMPDGSTHSVDCDDIHCVPGISEVK